MQFADVVVQRKMVRAFEARAVPADVLDRLLDLARRVPAAGNTQGLDLVVLEGSETQRYWNVTLTPERRAAFPWPQLLDAPVLIIPVSNPDAYVERYSESDKQRTGLGSGEDSWPVPYWYVDSAFSAMVAMLAAVDEGLGALFFGQFEHELAIKRTFGIPEDRRPVGTIALGYAIDAQRPSRSSKRQRRSFDEVVHRGKW
ncbi:MAG: nitroreductase family protein [Acidimicrobiales bacterium]